MNTLGEHLDHAERLLRNTADSLVNESMLGETRAKALLRETRFTVHALHDLLATTWGSAARSITTVDGRQPDEQRDALASLANALDRRISGSSLTGAPRGRNSEAERVATARHEVESATAIIRVHVNGDSRARTPDGDRLQLPASRWTLTERIAAVAASAARLETTVHDLWQKNPYTDAHLGRSHELHAAARDVLRTPHDADTAALALHEGGHRPLRRSVLSDVESPLEQLCQQVFTRAQAGDLDGVSVRVIATTGVLVTGHLEMIARAMQAQAGRLWNGPLAEIREIQLHRVAAEALTARQSWQQVQRELRPLQPVGRPDQDLTEQATRVRQALDAVTRRDGHWRPAEEIARSRGDVEDLIRATTRVAPDVEVLASMLDTGLGRSHSADLCIRADKIPGRETYVEERLHRTWIPAPPDLIGTVRATMRRAEAATRTMSVAAKETRLSIAHQSLEPRMEISARAAVSMGTVPDHLQQQERPARQI